MRSALLVMLLAGCAFGGVGVGVRGGVPVTEAWSTATTTVTNPGALGNTERWVVGPYVEFRFPLGIRLDIEALYRKLGVEYTSNAPGSVTVSSTGDSWQFPLLLKWAFLPGPVKPFVDGGINFHHINGFSDVPSTVELRNNNFGGTFGAGIEFKLGPVRISPEFRYTRWGREIFRDPLGTGLNTNLNQGDFLLGIGF